MSRCPLLVEFPAFALEGDSADKEHLVLPFICGMLPLIGGQSVTPFFNRDVNSQADFHAASPSEWQLACQREGVIRPLAETDRLSCLQVDRAAKILGLGRSVTYRLIAASGNVRRLPPCSWPKQAGPVRSACSIQGSKP
jgi:hypothetical protein